MVYTLFHETKFLGRPLLLDPCNAHTFVGVSECFIARTTLAIVPGEKEVLKRLNSSSFCCPCPPAAPCPSPLWRQALRWPLPLHQPPSP